MDCTYFTKVASFGGSGGLSEWSLQEDWATLCWTELVLQLIHCWPQLNPSAKCVTAPGKTNLTKGENARKAETDGQKSVNRNKTEKKKKPQLNLQNQNKQKQPTNKGSGKHLGTPKSEMKEQGDVPCFHGGKIISCRM